MTYYEECAICVRPLCVSGLYCADCGADILRLGGSVEVIDMMRRAASAAVIDYIEHTRDYARGDAAIRARAAVAEAVG